MLATRFSKGRRLHRKALALAISFAVAGSACSTNDTEVAEDDVTEGSVDQAWVEAAECLTSEGYSVETQRDGDTWSIAFEGNPEETSAFSNLYDNCVSKAETLNLAFLRAQVPDGTERVELADEFNGCLAEAGIESVVYDPNNPDQASALADAQTQLGYALDDPAVTDDPNFLIVLTCFQTYELLFPDRLEAND